MATPTIILLLPGTTGSTLIHYLEDPINHKTYIETVWPDTVIPALAGSVTGAIDLIKGQDLVPGIPFGWDSDSNTPTGYGAFNVNLQAQFSGSSYASSQVSFDSTGTPSIVFPSKQQDYLLIGFPYDWRKDNLDNANLVKQVVDLVDAQYQNTAHDIFLVAHSMGGFVARAYLETIENPSDNIKGLITLGTPHQGAPLALCAIMNNVLPNNNFSADNIEYDLGVYLQTQSTSTATGLMANLESIDPNFVNDFPPFAQEFVGLFPDGVSSYELLPPPECPFIDDTDGNSYSIYDSNMPQALQQYLTDNAAGISTNLAPAQTFWETLDPSKPNAPYFCIYGTGITPTCMRFVYDTSADRPLVDYPVGISDQASSTDISGDGIVPASSATGVQNKGTYEASGVTHDGLASDLGVAVQVANWIKNNNS